MSETNILVVEDDYIVARTIERCLAHEGFSINLASRGDKGLHLARQKKPDLIILDIIMPDMDGYLVCKAVRSDPNLAKVPIIFLTAKTKSMDKIKGFELGADDYICKPFNVDELVLRIQSILKRTQQVQPEHQDSTSIQKDLHQEDQNDPSACLVLNNFKLNPRSYELETPQRGTVRLTPLQFDLLYHLMTHQGQAFSPSRLLDEVWDYPSGKGSPDLVRVHIKTLRERIETDPHRPSFICTIPGKGYVIHPET